MAKTQTKRERHPLAGKTVTVTSGEFKGLHYHVEDWWENIAGKSWMFCDGNPACLSYAMRSAFEKPPLPTDNEVVYGKIGILGHLLHVSEIGGEITAK